MWLLLCEWLGWFDCGWLVCGGFGLGFWFAWFLGLLWLCNAVLGTLGWVCFRLRALSLPQVLGFGGFGLFGGCCDEFGLGFGYCVICLSGFSGCWFCCGFWGCGCCVLGTVVLVCVSLCGLRWVVICL